MYRKPPRLSWEEAAAFPLAALTAYRALFAVGRLQADETVLVLGAGSGVSTFAVQLAAQEGARVLVTSSSEAKIERAKELGAAGGVLYTDEGWPEAVGPVDLVLDSVGSTWRDSARALRPRRAAGRVRRHGRAGGDAGRPRDLPELEVHPQHDHGLAARLLRDAADGQRRRLAAR